MSEKTRTPLIPFPLLRSIFSRMMLALLIMVLTNGGYVALAHNPPVYVREKGSLSLTRSLVSRSVSKLSISPSTIFLAVIAVIDSGLMASLG
jgi:hypothetical protein